MSGLFDNPMGLMGLEFIEFAAPAVNTLESLLERTGFALVARHRSRDVVLYRQGSVNFIVNHEPGDIADDFPAGHGPSARGLAFRVRDARKAYALALERGAQPMALPTGPMERRLPAIKGIGGAPLYLIDGIEDETSVYDIDFEFLPDIDRPPHDVYRGRMAFRGSFYERIFGLHELRFLDDEGEYTGFASRAMAVPAGEPDEEPTMRGLLLDGSTQGGQSRLLMQIFGEPPLGPAFLEFIQRKNDDGLGEGNFKAFFEHHTQACEESA